MINTIIIEDEKLARENLVQSLYRVSGEINVVAALSTVKESIECFHSNISADIVFCDIQLSDGLSFEIFNKAKVKTPIIFLTGDDHFMMNAFEYNGIDYLVKPVKENELIKALQKYKMLQDHFADKTNEQVKAIPYPETKKRARLLVKRGAENFCMPLGNVALLFTKNRIVYAIDEFGKNYIAEGNLSELEEKLDDSIFFRVNRQYIINIDYVKSFRAYEKVKLKISMTPAALNEQHNIIISQEMAPAFRKWISEA